VRAPAAKRHVCALRLLHATLAAPHWSCACMHAAYATRSARLRCSLRIPPTAVCALSVFAASFARVLLSCCRSDEAEGTWKWQYDGNDMFMDIDEEARDAHARQLRAACVTHAAHLTCAPLHAARAQVRFRVAGVRFPARPISTDALRCVRRRCMHAFTLCAVAECGRCHSLLLSPARSPRRSVLSPLEGGMPGPAFAPMVVVVRPHASCALSRRCALVCFPAKPHPLPPSPVPLACTPMRQQRRAAPPIR
jgi:hypothetical protein